MDIWIFCKRLIEIEREVDMKLKLLKKMKKTYDNYYIVDKT